ncbi:hypothetical protein GCM10020221_13910 [Streptomyces thioluteus]|uniref:Uncharacterized protein n=1 Tax=Streptomyces thioluteus TaxID=66431 RepID=A0ABN3WMB8_STRTU
MNVTESEALPMVALFGIITVLLVRSRDVRWWEAFAITLFGVYLGQTPVLFTLNGLVKWLLSGFTHT